MPFIDLHCDTLYEMLRQGGRLYDNDLRVSVKKLRSAGVLCQFFAMYVNMREHPDPDAAFGQAQRMYELFCREMDGNRDAITQVKSAAGLDAAISQGKTAALLTVEEGGICGESIERLERLYDMGVRLITLTWNYENAIGFPNSDDGAVMGAGLKPFGLEFVGRMQQLGMIADVSHLSDGGFWDVAKHSVKPFVASHSNARALQDFRRNLTDRQLRAIAEKGGVCGVNFYHHFLGEDGSGSIEQIVRHIRHIKNTAGIDTVAIGSDFDGFSGPCGICDAASLPLLSGALESAGFTYDEIEKICWKNALRVLRDTL